MRASIELSGQIRCIISFFVTKSQNLEDSNKSDSDVWVKAFKT